MIKQLKIAAACCIILLLSACIKKKKDDFNRTELLNSMYTMVIQPGYTGLKDASATLQTAANSFLTSPDSASLSNLKDAFYVAYANLQYVEALDFSSESALRNDLNSFPSDTAQIDNNIASGSYNLSTVNNLRAKGFPALDYLLYGKPHAQTISDFSGNANRKQYLTDVVSDIVSKANAASNWWNANKTTFVNASGTDVGSSVGMLVNDMSFEMERNRRERVGTPLGYVGLIFGGSVAPQTTEAYYSGYSKEMFLENLKGLAALYSGAGGVGFDDYLTHLGADYNGTPLANEISTQFVKVRTAAEQIPVPFSQAVTTHNAEMQTLFLELKKLTVLIKVDMSSQLGVIINYSDNDGD
ncbi:MAG: imelysin family protein [Chitinophagales bacterium]|nr:imelysin family protein [Chitinophagales bacterium]